VIGCHHDAVLAGQQRLGIQRVADVAADPVHRRGHDPVIGSHLTPQPRPEPAPRQRVCRPGHLPVIGPRDDVSLDAGRGVEDLVGLAGRAAGLVGLAAQPADPHQASAAPVVVRGQHVIHDACSVSSADYGSIRAATCRTPETSPARSPARMCRRWEWRGACRSSRRVQPGPLDWRMAT
jgi:hypothetical protein